MLQSEIDQLERSKPSPFAGGFGHPELKADFNRWVVMEKLTENEAICLSIGVEPQEISRNASVGLHPELLFFFNERLEILRRSSGKHKLGDGWISPKEFCIWAKSNTCEVHPSFVQAYSDEKRSRPNRPIDLREKNTLLKIVGALLVEAYGIQSAELPADSVVGLNDKIARIGHELGPKTVNAKVRDALKLIPKDYWTAQKDA